jgi:hypothetical protein
LIIGYRDWAIGVSSGDRAIELSVIALSGYRWLSGYRRRARIVAEDNVVADVVVRARSSRIAARSPAGLGLGHNQVP